MKTLNYNKKNYAEHELELSAHSYEQDFQSWISPYYRLACNEISSLKTAETNNSGHMGLYAYGLFQGISVEVIRNFSLAQRSQLTFAEQYMPLCFSLRLAGSGSICLHKRTPTLLQTPGALTIGYFPCCRGTVVFQPEVNTLVNVMVRRAVIRKCMPRQAAAIYNFLRIDEQEGYVLRTITASTGLKVAAQQLLSPPASSNTQSIFLSGASLQFLALAIDSLYTHLEHGHIIRLEKRDIATLEKIKIHIENNMANPPSLETLCKKFYINSFKLKKGFKQIYGMTISGYMQYYRLYCAYNCFLQGDVNVSECAWKVGYTNVSHFIAAFRRQFGFTPGECIRNHKEGLSSLQHIDTKPVQRLVQKDERD